MNILYCVNYLFYYHLNKIDKELTQHLNKIKKIKNTII